MPFQLSSKSIDGPNSCRRSLSSQHWIDSYAYVRYPPETDISVLRIKATEDDYRNRKALLLT